MRALQGFEQAIAQYGLDGITVTCEPSFQGGLECMGSALAQRPELSAAIVMQETAIAGMTQALDAAGLSVPDDFSIVTILSPRQAEMMTPPLTSIDFPAAEMGRIGAEMLIQQLEGHSGRPVQQLLRANLWIGGLQATIASVLGLALMAHYLLNEGEQSHLLLLTFWAMSLPTMAQGFVKSLQVFPALRSSKERHTAHCAHESG